MAVVLGGVVSIPLVVYGNYDVFWWLDEIAHLSGGIVVALALDAVVPRGHDGDVTERIRTLVVGVVLLSLCWEAIELLFDSSVSTAGLGIRRTPAPFEQYRSFDAWFEDSLLDTIVAAFGAWVFGRQLARLGVLDPWVDDVSARRDRSEHAEEPSAGTD